MFDSGEFYTLKGYSSLADGETLTTAMEDYLEMMYRLYVSNEDIRIKKISDILHVKPSSASKMAVILKNLNYIEFEKYGQITLTDKGKSMGNYLLYRHNVLHDFFCRINNSDNELMLVEKIEHFINRETVENIRIWLDRV
jgi:Mn-dependent DtxR family transcriptional regulator